MKKKNKKRLKIRIDRILIFLFCVCFSIASANPNVAAIIIITNGVPFIYPSPFNKNTLLANSEIIPTNAITFSVFGFCHINTGNTHIKYHGWNWVISPNKNTSKNIL